MFSNEIDFSLLLGHQRIGEVKNKCNFANILGRMAEKRATKRLEKVTKRGFFTVLNNMMLVNPDLGLHFPKSALFENIFWLLLIKIIALNLEFDHTIS